ncbi:protein kinase domain-containing protein [Terriglobus sp.]|uniref:protein kinase domain-containing protein n=1 Tax=Terriglobus sp. TaxID=1889013 RepID=UPI003B008EA0
MNPEHWERIKATLDELLEKPPDERPKLLHALCGSDPTLEAEVSKLLHAYQTSEDFLERGPALLCAPPAPRAPERPALESGTVLANRFQIRSFINRGGMGEVYEAWDSELNQAVALKTILPSISAHTAVIQRFKQEVRHAREVSHPNICRVHELFCDATGVGGPVWFLSMELIPGTTLLDYICSRGNLPAKLALRIADQMLAGLEAAHARGLVHRDLKSSNVMLIESDGALVRAVITDFGLAIRNVEGSTPGDMVATGTPGYMAPEQRRGENVGPAADQYAFGVVLCEMMTGLLPQERADDRHGPRQIGYPTSWSKVIHRCTREQVSQRFRDMAAVRAALLPESGRKRLSWTIAATLVAAMSMTWPMLRRPQAAALPVCVICNSTQITPDVDKSESPSLSQDGSLVAYSSDRAEPGNLDIFVQQLPSGRLTRITHDGSRDTAPSLSPDGKLVAFRSERAGGGIYISYTQVPEEPKLLVKSGRDPKISPDGKTLLYWTGEPDSNMSAGKAFRIDLERGAPEQIATSFADARYPVWSDDGRHVMLTGCSLPGLVPDCFDWWIGTPQGDSFTATHAFGALRSRGFSPGRLASVEWTDDQVVFSAIAPEGRLNLAAVTIPANTSPSLGVPHWLVQSDAGELEPSIAGKRVAFTKTSGALHVWQMRGLGEGAKPVLEKVTADPEVDSTPFISAGGSYLVFARGRGLRRTIVLHDMASGQESVVVNQGTPVQSPIIDRTGKWLAYQQAAPDGSAAIYAGRVGGPMGRICQNCTEPFGWFGDRPAFLFRDGAHTLALFDIETQQRRAILTDATAVLGDACWSSDVNGLVLIKTAGTRKQITVLNLNRATAQPEGPETSVVEDRGNPMRPRWFNKGRNLLYVSNRDGFMCLYLRRFDEKKRVFGEPFALAHFHHQRASIDDVLPRALNLSVDQDSLFLNLGEQSSTIQVGELRSKP